MQHFLSPNPDPSLDLNPSKRNTDPKLLPENSMLYANVPYPAVWGVACIFYKRNLEVYSDSKKKTSV